MKNRAYPKRVDVENRPEITVENVPEEVLQQALNDIRCGMCPDCETKQFYCVVPGHNASHDCVECGLEMKIVG